MRASTRTPGDSHPDVTSTVSETADLATERSGRTIRRIALGLFAVLVMLGLTGSLGVRSATVGAGPTNGLRIELTYARVARPALAVPFRLVVSQPGGFDDAVEVRIDREWMESFDENGVSPEPDAATTEGSDLVWTFDPPPGVVFTLSLDTRIEPGVQWKRKGTTTVTSGDRRLSVAHTMWVLP